MNRLNGLLYSIFYLMIAVLPAHSGIKTYTDRALFLAETGAVDVIVDYPLFTNTPPKMELTVSGGPESITFRAEDIFTGNATDLLPGLELRVSFGTPASERLSESIDVELEGERYSFGFDLVEPSGFSGFIDSIFQITLYLDQEYVGHFTFAPPDDVVAFAGVWSEKSFNRIEIREIKGSNENEHYGHFYTGKNIPQSFSPLISGKPTKLLADDGGPFTALGASAALDNNTVLVGVPFSDDKDIDAGAAYFFVYKRGRWILQDKILANDGQPDDRFGYSVSLDGDTAIIGAPNHGPGAAYVFVRQGTQWVQSRKLFDKDGETGDNFGLSVDLDGDTALIGADQDDRPLEQPGAAYIFVHQGGNWSQQEKLEAIIGLDPVNEFGRAVALDGGTAVIGSQGAADVFVRQGSTWNHQFKLQPYMDDYNFGLAVAVDGEDTALIGSLNSSAYVFVRHGAEWAQQAKLILGGTDSFIGSFGRSVALDGDNALIGARTADITAEDAGAVFVFSRQGTTWYQQQPMVLADDGVKDDRFGTALALNDSKALVGAPFVNNNRVQNAGAAYVYGYPDQRSLPLVLNAAIQTAVRQGENTRSGKALAK